MKTSGIYCWIISRPGKPDLYYIGQSIDVWNRKASHLRGFRRPERQGANRRLTTLFQKYGEEAFSFHLLLCCPRELLTKEEQRILDEYKTLFGRRVLNICQKCVDSPRGIRHTELSRRNMSIAKKGKPGRRWTEEERAKLRETKKKQGIHPNTRAAQRLAATGKKASNETRAKMSAARKGKALSEAHRAAISAGRRKAAA